MELEHPSTVAVNNGARSSLETECNRWFEQKDTHSPVCFGYMDIDRFYKLTEGCVLLVAGYTGVGIDMFAQNIVRHNIKSDVRVIYFNLKESSNTILNSMIAAEGLVKTTDIRMASLTDEDWKRIAIAANSFGKSQLIFEPYDSETSKASYFISAVASGNADMVILDDLDGLDIGDTSSLNSFLYKLRGAASQSGTIVVMLVDLEENPKRVDKRPMLTDPKINIEEIISSLSFVISLYNEIPHMQELPNRVIAKQVATKRSQKILLLACKIRFLQELQQANEQFCYACCLEGNGELPRPVTIPLL